MHKQGFRLIEKNSASQVVLLLVGLQISYSLVCVSTEQIKNYETKQPVGNIS